MYSSGISYFWWLNCGSVHDYLGLGRITDHFPYSIRHQILKLYIRYPTIQSFVFNNKNHFNNNTQI